jgi:hypothetical protein
MQLRYLLHAILAIAGFSFCCNLVVAGETTVLVENGRSAWRIVVAEDASLSIKHAAHELQGFVAEMTGAKLPIVTDRQPLADCEILIGDSAHLRQSGVSVDIPSLGAEGYHLKTAGRRLVIAGGPLRGALYGVYGLLEDHWGCRWFTPEVSRIPRVKRLELPALDERVIPPLEYREVGLWDAFDGDWAARNRLNSHDALLTERHGGKIAFGRKGLPYGWFVHTFYLMVPPSEYYNSHPEYFSLVGGKRPGDPNYGQLCCTNEEVIRLCTKAVLAAMKAEPDAHYFSVSQSDTFPEAPNYCECERCQKLARAEESQMAPVLALVNRVAEAVEREFPQNTVETLAYRWTRKPPKTMRPRQNVVVRLCDAECCFVHPLETCDYEECRKFREDIKAWSKTGARFWVWNYVTSFGEYLLPFPSQQVQGENIRFFARNGARGVFEQDAWSTFDSELAALGGYMMAKSLWNPNYDETRARDEFLAAYYGPAAEQVRQYMALLADRVKKNNIHLGIDMAVLGHVGSPHVSDDLLLAADAIWETAERNASANAATLRRVKVSRMSVDYAIVERARLELAGRLPLNPSLKALALKRFDPYLKTLATSRITSLSEGVPLNLRQYRESLAAGLGIAKPR